MRNELKTNKVEIDAMSRDMEINRDYRVANINMLLPVC